MNAITPRGGVTIAASGYLALLLPPVRHALESSMTAQMLLQIPLLIGVGYVLRAALPRHFVRRIDAWNHGGVAGLVMASMATLVWMVPRLLDAAVTDPWAAAAKFIAIPLLIGLPLGLSWPRMGFIVRGVFLLELIATFFRLGWLYLISPVRLCSNYLLGDQQRLGECMLAIGMALLVAVAGILLWGRFEDGGRFAERKEGRSG